MTELIQTIAFHTRPKSGIRTRTRARTSSMQAKVVTYTQAQSQAQTQAPSQMTDPTDNHAHARAHTHGNARTQTSAAMFDAHGNTRILAHTDISTGRQVGRQRNLPIGRQADRQAYR